MNRAAFLFLAIVAMLCPAGRSAEAIAIAFVFDTSGSMLESVKDTSGAAVQKFEVGRKAMVGVVEKLSQFAKSSGRPLEVSLFFFDGKTGVREVLARGKFDAARLLESLPQRKDIAGGTPLGRATEAAAKSIAKSQASSRHVIVLTDGENTVGPKPEDVIRAATEPVQYHFIAFDVDARVFAGVKQTGATLLSAGNAKQLDERLGFLLEDKILLEKE
jgi:hypothetical protein